MAIELPTETKHNLIQAIRYYFLEELDHEIGDLQASFFLEFVLQEVGPSIYNQAIHDAQAVLQRAVADLDVTLHAPPSGSRTSRGGPPGRGQ